MYGIQIDSDIRITGREPNGKVLSIVVVTASLVSTYLAPKISFLAKDLPLSTTMRRWHESPASFYNERSNKKMWKVKAEQLTSVQRVKWATCHLPLATSHMPHSTCNDKTLIKSPRHRLYILCLYSHKAFAVVGHRMRILNVCDYAYATFAANI